MAHGPLLVIATPQGQLGNTLTHFAGIRAFAIKRKLSLLHLAFERFNSFFPATDQDLFSSYSPSGDIEAHPLALALAGIFRAFLSRVSGDLNQPGRGADIIATPLEALIRARDPDLRHMGFIFGCSLVKWVQAGQFKELPITLVRHEEDKELDLETDPNFQKLLEREQIILLDGWLIRANAALQEHTQEVRGYFTPNWEISQMVDSAIGTARSRGGVLVGVHIRRGDYAQWMDGMYFWSVETYANWMRVIAQQLPGTKITFLVCCEEQLAQGQFEGLDVVFGPGMAASDMYSLAGCDLIFGPPSTFSDWARFYGGSKRFNMLSAEPAVTEIVNSIRNLSAA
jgi:hypothetical protein